MKSDIQHNDTQHKGIIWDIQYNVTFYLQLCWVSWRSAITAEQLLSFQIAISCDNLFSHLPKHQLKLT